MARLPKTTVPASATPKRKRTPVPPAPMRSRVGASLRHVTDLGVLDRYLRGIDDEDTGGGPRVGSPYKQLPVIFRGINVAASALARVPFEIWDQRTGEPVLETQGGPAGELVRLFKKPHPAMPWRKFVETVIIHYHYGQAFLWPRGLNSYGVPSKILPVPPSSVRPLRDAGDDLFDLEYFEYRRASGKTLRISVDELLRLEYAANPDDPFVGVSPFQPGRVQLDADFLAGVYQRSTMMNGGSPGGILSFDGDEDELPRAEADKLEGEWQRKFGAASSNSKVAILTGKWNYQVLGFRPRDMEFLALRKYSVEEAARLLNVPQVYLSSWENVGLSDAGLKSQERLLYTINTIPLAAKFAEVLNEGIIWKVDRNLEAIFNFDSIEALRDDMGLKAQTAHSFLNMGFTLAQVNERFDLGFDVSEMNWAAESLIGTGLVPARILVEQAIAQQEQQIKEAENAAQAPPELPAPLPMLPPPTPPDANLPPHEVTVPGEEDNPIVAPTAPTVEVGQRAVRSVEARKISKKILVRAQREFIKAHKQSENYLFAKLRSALMTYRSGVLRRIVKLQAKRGKRSLEGVAEVVMRASGDDEELVLQLEDISELMDEIDDGVMVDILRESTRRAFEGGVRTTEQIMEAIGVPIEDLAAFQKDRLPEIVDRYIDARLGTSLPTRVNDQIRASVNEVIVSRIENGGSLRDAIQGVKDVFRASLSRARTIARTETQIAMAASRMAQYEAEGVEEHVWITAGDEFVRDSHEKLDGVIRKVGEEFLPMLTRPGDPDADPSEIINCRCQAVAVSRSMARKLEQQRKTKSAARE